MKTLEHILTAFAIACIILISYLSIDGALKQEYRRGCEDTERKYEKMHNELCQSPIHKEKHK